MDDTRKNYIELVNMFCTALEDAGYDVLSAIELWHTVYKPEIKALSPGKYTYYIGKTEISFKIKK